MSAAPTPQEIYASAEQEGRRRLTMPPLEQVSTAFIAGVTVVLGITALGVTEHLARPALGEDAAKIVGALGFGIGLVFLVVGRSELFSENFFDPVAAALDEGPRGLLRLLRLWVVVLALNLVGGAVLLSVLTVQGALPEGANETLVRIAEETAVRQESALLARAVLAGVLLTLLSYLLHAVGSARGRITVAFLAGFLVALGPFDHSVVSGLHVLFGVWEGAPIGYLDVLRTVGLATVGNVAGGVLLMTLTHTAQVKGARASGR